MSRGSDFQYRSGYPELRAVASGIINEDDLGIITISSELVYGSLIYKKENGLFTANATLDIQISSLEVNDTKAINDRLNFDIRKEEPSVVHSQETYLFQKDYTVTPGNYLVGITIIDESTGKSTTRKEQVFIPNPKKNISNITKIQILSKTEDVKQSIFTPETTYDIPSSIDSLKFVFQITNNKPDSPITINAELIKFKSDTSFAWPMTYNNYYPSSMPYKGIDYHSQEVINSTRRTLTDPGSVLIEFVFPALERGNYRLEVQSEGDVNDENKLYKARDFSIKSPNYPSLKTPRELAEPLAYLMGEKEYKQLLKIQSPDSLKRAIDKFWLSNIKNSKTASDVIALYYERVEEANKQFSSFKEGWKTDLGMMYILFGPPWYVDTTLDEMRWSYSYNLSDPEKNFYFKTPKIKNKYFPFDNYLLKRTNYYYNIQYQQMQLWLSGLILTRNM
ncbi:MAG: GWxTD domain-containing protein [Balneolaceae bacterium]